jgi:LacI family transcriptional regulator, repressor for deo operon, udp, cdd, tsx, nupC, and nupG
MVVTRKTPTIQDVARHANVSAATVSRALSSPERVSETTRARVEEAVRTTGYTINQAARSLRLRAAKTIVVALPNIGNPFYSTILDSVVVEASARGYGVLVASHQGDESAERLSDYFFSNRADGLLLFDGGIDTRMLNNIRVHGGKLPLIVAYDEIPDPMTNSVLTDNREAARRAVRYLAEIGHTKIGHVTGHSRNELPNERLVGFEEEMEALGLEVRRDWIMKGDYTMPTGMAAGDWYAAMTDRPTAMFMGNDEMSIGFIASIRDHGLECPRDVSVMGFDDITVAAHYAPPLTTMRQPREAIGRRATEALIDILEDPSTHRAPLRLVLRSELVIRGSTAPLLAQPPLRRSSEAVPG